MKWGIMGAMEEEVSRLLLHLEAITSETHGMRNYVSGRCRGRDVTVVFSRWGKVAAASTATTLVERYGVTGFLFSGVAGAIHPELNVGDIVVADKLIQHDMDVSALAGLERFQVPLLGFSEFDVAANHVRAAHRAAATYLADDLRREVAADTLAGFQMAEPRAFTGAIASGDRFVADDRESQELRERIPGLLCVDMESAAVAQVAHEHGLPCIVLRAISDKADRSAVVDFPRFVRHIASQVTCGTVLRLLDALDP